MATLLLTAVGTLVGGPIGGALGALAGQQIDRAVLGAPTRKGPRLKDLSIQSSSYGAAIPRIYGTMRVAGSVIWATELAEHKDKSGGGKGKPKTVSYSYTSSFAVALSSRPVERIGRIWADGNLLRGEAGDLKVAGAMRLHTGTGDQAVDPLIAAAEGADTCPAFRNIAYAVFEDLALSDFGNRIPSLTFEVIADDGPVALDALVRDAVPEAEVEPIPQTVTGYAVEAGGAAALIDDLGDVVPLTCVSRNTRLIVAPGEPIDPTPAPLPPPADGAEGEHRAGATRQRERTPGQRPAALRYYDIARDFQPGLQRARGRTRPGEPATLEFPAALDAAAARGLADAIARRHAQARETARYRIAEVDAALAPGRQVSWAGERGEWLIESWELDAQGVELGLLRLPTTLASSLGASDAGRANTPPDLLAFPTSIAAFELPWDGIGAGDTPALFAAVSSASAGWTGAALFAEGIDGGLEPLGASGRSRATLGVAATALGVASPHVVDRVAALEVELVAEDLSLAGASLTQLAMGENRALVGRELIQFARAERIGPARWRIGDLLRGRGGTESAIDGHAAGEAFVLIDDALTPLDPARVGDAERVRIAAVGLADSEPVFSAIALSGATLRPLSPVHGAIEVAADGAIALRWTRRARGAWLWRDALEVPLVESSEAYRVTLGSPAAPIAQWQVAEPRLELSASEASALRAVAAGAPFAVRQIGDRGVSEPLPLGTL